MEREQKSKGMMSPRACRSDITARKGPLFLDSLVPSCMHAFILPTAGGGGA